MIKMIVVVFIFIVFGILIKYGKLYFFIVGYNIFLKEEKEKYDIEGILMLFWNVMFGMVMMIFVGYFIDKIIEILYLLDYFFWVLMIIGVFYLLIVVNLKKYKRLNWVYLFVWNCIFIIWC